MREIVPLVAPPLKFKFPALFSLFFPGDGDGLFCCRITSESNRWEREGLATMLVDLGSFFRMSSREHVDDDAAAVGFFLGVRGLISMRGGGGRLSGGSSSKSTDLMTCTEYSSSC